MISTSHTLPRGAALLVVLAILIVTTTSAVILAEVTSTISLQYRLDQDSRNADAVLTTTDEIIQHWLATESSSVVLPVESSEPSIIVLNDQISLSETDILIRITAWDQYGMVPIQLVESGSPLRLALPGELVDVIDGAELDNDIPYGLDLIHSSNDDIQLLVYPRHDASAPILFEDHESSFERSDQQDQSDVVDARLDTQTLAIGAIIATHNPPPGQININTAPLAIVERALLEVGRGGLDLIEQSRREGKPVAMNSLPASERRRDQQASVRLVGSSSAWSFRIDVEVGIAHRSWWAVYQHKDSKWECVQRLVIKE